MNEQERIEYFKEQIARLSNQVVDLQNERDALAAKNVELIKAIKAIENDCIECSYDDESGYFVGNDAISDACELAHYKTPQQHLAEMLAEAGKVGYYNGFKDALVIEPPLPQAVDTSTAVDFFVYRVGQASRYAAEQYAAKMRQGGE